MNKQELYSKIDKCLYLRYGNVSQASKELPFAFSKNGPVKVVSLDTVGYEMVDKLKRDLLEIVQEL